MKLKVIIRFKDKYSKSVIYEVGQLVDFDDEARCADLQNRGLAVPVETKKDSGKLSANSEKEEVEAAEKTSNSEKEEVKPAKKTAPKTAKNSK